MFSLLHLYTMYGSQTGIPEVLRRGGRADPPSIQTVAPMHPKNYGNDRDSGADAPSPSATPVLNPSSSATPMLNPQPPTTWTLPWVDQRTTGISSYPSAFPLKTANPLSRHLLREFLRSPQVPLHQETRAEGVRVEGDPPRLVSRVQNNFHQLVFKESLLLNAADTSNIQQVQVLLYKGLHPNCVDQFGNTPLMKAARNGHTPIIMALFNYGADLNLQNFLFKQTALMQACISRQREAVRLLLALGADPTILNNVGQTPLEAVCSYRLDDIMSLFNIDP